MKKIHHLQFMQLAWKAMKNKWIKKTQKPKEKDIQASIVSNFMKNCTNWKEIAQEVQYEKECFEEGGVLILKDLICFWKHWKLKHPN